MVTDVPQDPIDSRILMIRSQKVMIDADLATLYGVLTKALNQAVKRNARRFPSDFMFQLTAAEKLEVITNCDHLAGLKFSKSLPFVFTEHGAIQAASVLNSEQAADMAVYVVRAFVRLRAAIISNQELATRLGELEHKVELMSVKQDRFEDSTRAQLQQLVAAIRGLMAPPEPPVKRPIGFVAPQSKPPKAAAQ